MKPLSTAALCCCACCAAWAAATAQERHSDIHPIDEPAAAQRRTGAYHDFQVAGPMNIELDIFSGRPNPRWAPDADEAAALWPWLGRAQAGVWESGVAVEPGLGPRGFLLTWRGEGDAAPTVWRVFDGRVIEAGRSAAAPRELIDLLNAQATRRGWGAALQGR